MSDQVRPLIEAQQLAEEAEVVILLFGHQHRALRVAQRFAGLAAEQPDRQGIAPV